MLKILIDIITFKKGPQDVPFGTNYLLFYMVVLLGLSTLGAFVQYDDTKAIKSLVVEYMFPLAIQLTFLYTALNYAKKQARFVQVATALLGVTLLFQFFIVVIATIYFVLVKTSSVVLLPNISLVLFVIAIWVLSITANILRQAFDTSYLGGLFIAIVMYALVMLSQAIS